MVQKASDFLSWATRGYFVSFLLPLCRICAASSPSCPSCELGALCARETDSLFAAKHSVAVISCIDFFFLFVSAFLIKLNIDKEMSC